MRIFIALACSLALVSAVYAQQENKQHKKKQTQSALHAAKPTSHPAASGGASKRTPTATTGARKPTTGHTSTAAYQPPKAKKSATQAERQTAKATKERQTTKTTNTGQVNGGGKPNQTKTATRAGQSAAKRKFAQGKPVTAHHFNLSKQPNTAKAPPVKFQQGRHIQGSQNWDGQQYTVFRNYSSQWHNRNWWHNHYRNNIVFVFGAPYYWNAGYWFPAWGYYPNAYYAWDGPIYAYNRLPPDQVIANVQAALQQQGYYQGAVDGLIGPITRGAVADYQRDHGLYITSAIDQPTLQSLGMT